jgi:hypothetical protein
MSVRQKLTHGIIRLIKLLSFLALGTLLATLMSASTVSPSTLEAQVRNISGHNEFDYASWTVDALLGKFSDWALSLEKFMPPDAQSQVVLDYLQQVQEISALDNEILAIYSDPSVEDPDLTTAPTRERLQSQINTRDNLTPLVEAILQNQLTDVLQDSDIDVANQVFPASLYHFSETPLSLVISPRTTISQVLDVPLLPDLNTTEIDGIEQQVYSELDYSALIVPIGGIGLYPTMVMQTSNIVWLTEVISHEWIHNFLTLRPLGINYFTNEELRTINETTASLAGKELGRLILEKYYPQFVPPEPKNQPSDPDDSAIDPPSEPEAFDFRTEMRETRVETDRLLAEGKIKQAEDYMESRRQFFWENGYGIRKLNQAYFAFYGAYNDEPGGGAAGEDPVGPAVVALRAQYNHLSDFLNDISWVTSFEKLQDLLAR